MFRLQQGVSMSLTCNMRSLMNANSLMTLTYDCAGALNEVEMDVRHAEGRQCILTTFADVFVGRIG